MNTDRSDERNKRPRAAQWLLDRLLPPDADSVAGDIAESYEIRRARDGARIADRWYRREVAATLAHIGFSRLARHRLAGFALVAGAAAATASIRFGVNGSETLLAYAGLMFVVALYLSATKRHSFRQRLAASVGSFMTMTSILYLFIIGFDNPAATSIPLWGHAWRLGMMLVIGGLVGLIVALVSGDSYGARMSLVAVLLPWVSYGYWLVTRSRWEDFPLPLKVLLPYESYSVVAPSLAIFHLRVGLWLGLAVNTALWVTLAVMTASLVMRRRNRSAQSGLAGERISERD